MLIQKYAVSTANPPGIVVFIAAIDIIIPTSFPVLLSNTPPPEKPGQTGALQET